MKTSYQFGVGIASRGAFRRWLKQSCFNLGLTLDLDEDKGWLRSLFTVDVEGPDAEVAQLEQALDDLIKRMEARRK